jgi:mRNA interferase MazF
MKPGKMYKGGEVVLTKVQFTDTFEIKKRPALVLFEEFDNVIVAGITSNLEMEGIPLTKKEGAVKDSIIKLNYIFTVSKVMIERVLFSLSKEKKRLVYDDNNSIGIMFRKGYTPIVSPHPGRWKGYHRKKARKLYRQLKNRLGKEVEEKAYLEV